MYCSVINTEGKLVKVLRSNLPIAKVEKPLRYIRAKCIVRYQDNKGQWHTDYTRPYPIARIAARNGDGFIPQYYATNHAITGAF